MWLENFIDGRVESNDLLSETHITSKITGDIYYICKNIIK